MKTFRFESTTPFFCGVDRSHAGIFAEPRIGSFSRKVRRPMFQLQQLDHIALTVRDVDKSVRWYQTVLGLVRQHEEVWGSCPAVLSVTGTSLALFPVSSDNPTGPFGPGTICIRHVAFRTDRENFDRARKDLAAMGMKIEFQDHEIAHSIYFLDPDGHQLEITTYEL